MSLSAPYTLASGQGAVAVGVQTGEMVIVTFSTAKRPPGSCSPPSSPPAAGPQTCVISS